MFTDFWRGNTLEDIRLQDRERYGEITFKLTLGKHGGRMGDG
jgi:hypothetical protein